MPKFIQRNTSQLSDSEYQHYILQGVSRTFALTIPELPDALREVVGNGYLLCRIADTIEDDATISIEEKKTLAREFITLCENKNISAESFTKQFLPRLSTQTPAAEKDLVANTQRVLNVLHNFPETQQKILARCVRTMLDGMIYFQANSSIQGLKDLASMNSYCYHVAGVVGEMLTELYCDYSKEIALQKESLLPLSVSFGQGLQMTNILKDIWVDYQRGMCWLPQELFTEHGIALHQLPDYADSENFAAAMQTLIGIASGHLHNAMDYTLRIPKQEKGLRLFSLWAIGMAQLSLRKLNNNLDFSLDKQVKITRRSVQVTLLLTRLANSSNRILKFLFNSLSKTFPKKSTPPINIKSLYAPYNL